MQIYTDPFEAIKHRKMMLGSYFDSFLMFHCFCILKPSMQQH